MSGELASQKIRRVSSRRRDRKQYRNPVSAALFDAMNRFHILDKEVMNKAQAIESTDSLSPAPFPTELNISEGLVLGTDDFKEWVKTKYFQGEYLAGRSVSCNTQDWNIVNNWDMNDWLESTPIKFRNYITSETHNDTYVSIVDLGWGLAKFHVNSTILSSTVYGPLDKVKGFIEDMSKEFTKSETFIEWVISNDGNSVNVPLNYKQAHQSFYPWLNKPFEQYLKDYLESDSCALILIGPPGTGKTTFLKNLIHLSKSPALVTYDPKILSNDYFFSRFISGNDTFLIMEDADAFLSARSDGNDLMHRFLNISDGIVSLRNKKMIFTTNLPNISSIDPALIRPGRCFDILSFRPLNGDEANKVVKDLGLKDKETYTPEIKVTLAEIFHPGMGATASKPSIRGKFGF